MSGESQLEEVPRHGFGSKGDVYVSVVQISFTSGVWAGSKSHRIIYLCKAGVNVKAVLNIWEPKKGFWI